MECRRRIHERHHKSFKRPWNPICKWSSNVYGSSCSHYHLDILLPSSNHIKFTTSASHTKQGGGYGNPASSGLCSVRSLLSVEQEKSHYLEKFALFPDLAPWASSSQQVYRQWTSPQVLISNLLSVDVRSSLTVLPPLTASAFRKKFRDPLPPGVTSERISGIFTVPTEHGEQTKELFLCQHSLPSLSGLVRTGWLVRMFAGSSGVS
jgi:hypothetical protein